MINVRAAVLAGRLLESDMEFYNKLTPAEDTLELYGCDQPNLLDADAFGQMEVWWSVEIEARTWGIKDIMPYVKKLVLDGWYEVPDAEGDMQQADTGFRYEYPESEPTPKNIGPDVDAPTSANVVRLATPKWTLEYGVDPHKNSRTTFTPTAEVDLRKRTIEIRF